MSTRLIAAAISPLRSPPPPRWRGRAGHRPCGWPLGRTVGGRTGSSGRRAHRARRTAGLRRPVRRWRDRQPQPDPVGACPGVTMPEKSDRPLFAGWALKGFFGAIPECAWPSLRAPTPRRACRARAGPLCGEARARAVAERFAAEEPALASWRAALEAAGPDRKRLRSADRRWEALCDALALPAYPGPSARSGRRRAGVAFRPPLSPERGARARTAAKYGWKSPPPRSGRRQHRAQSRSARQVVRRPCPLARTRCPRPTSRRCTTSCGTPASSGNGRAATTPASARACARQR